MKATSLVFLGLLTAAGAMGCSSTEEAIASEEETTDEAELRAKGMLLGESDNGKTVNVKYGSSVGVKLPTRRSAGYQWYVASAPKKLGAPTVRFGGASGPVGAPGTTTFTWKIAGPMLKSGTFDVQLEYKQGERGEPLKRFALTINVVSP